MPRQHRRIPTLTEKQMNRLNSRISGDDADVCWLWTHRLDNWGYAVLSIRQNGVNYGSLRVSRIMWAAYHGDPGILCVLHRCDHPARVNPNHLFLGTVADNNKDRARKGRGAKMNPAVRRKGDAHWTRKRPIDVVKGEKHDRAKLTEEKVWAIRRRKLCGESYLTLAREFGVSKSEIKHIVARRSWKHI